MKSLINLEKTTFKKDYCLIVNCLECRYFEFVKVVCVAVKTRLGGLGFALMRFFRTIECFAIK